MASDFEREGERLGADGRPEAPARAAPLPAPTATEDEPRSGWRAGWESGRAAAERVRTPVSRALSLSWVPLTAALLSLILSVASIVISTHQPEVMLILPDQVRVAQGRTSGSAFVYLQPAFVSTGQNERVEVIRDMTLEVSTPPAGTTSFRWDEQAELVGDPDTGGLSYRYLADAVPLLVSPRSASAPLCLFDAPDGWYFQPGTYTFTLVAHRVVASEPVRGVFTATLTADDIAFLDGPGQDQFLTLPLVGTTDPAA